VGMGWAEKEIKYLYSRDFKGVVTKLPPLLREFYVRSVSERPLKLGLGEKLIINENYEIDIEQRDRLLKKFELLVKQKPYVIYEIMRNYEAQKRKYFLQPNFDNLVDLYSYELRWYYPYQLLEELLLHVYGPGKDLEILNILLTPTIQPAFLLESDLSFPEAVSRRKETLEKIEEIKREIIDCTIYPLFSLALVDGIHFTINQNEELRSIRYYFFKKNYPYYLKFFR
jgi:hypothetical protein